MTSISLPLDRHTGVAALAFPLALLLAIINIVGREDLSGTWKVVWILISFLWGIGPILYILLGGGKLW